MKDEIELNEKYLMLIDVSYLKYVSEGKATYQVTSRIVNKAKYLEEDYTGEIEGSYIKTIPVHFYKNTLLKQYQQKQIKKKIKDAIHKFHALSKKLVSEWENTDEVMVEAQHCIAQLK